MTYEPVTLDHLLEHQSWALRLARQLVREEHEAEELVQRTWIAALRRPPSTGRGARAWIRQVILNLARERHRRSSTRARHELASRDPEQTAPDVAEAASREEIRTHLAERLLALQDPYRTVLTLRYYEDLTSSEIATRLGVPAGTVRWRMKVGLDQLREELDRESHGDRQRWVSALLVLLPRGESVRTPAEEAPLGSGGLGWLPGVAGVASLTGLAWFLWPREETAASSPASQLAVEPDRPAASGPLVAPTQEVLRAAAPVVSAPETGSAAQPGSTLALRVRDAGGQAIEGARILVLARGSSEERARTDAHGEARVALRAADTGALGVAATRARVALLVLADGHAASPLWHVDAARERTAPLELTLAAPAQPLAGRLLDPHGTPVAGATLAWYEPTAALAAVDEQDYPGPVTLTATSAADGRFVLPHVGAAGATLLVQAAGFAPTSLQVEHLERELEFVLRPGATVAGRVLRADGRPAADVRVGSEPVHKASEWAANVPGYDASRRGFPEETRTDAEGRFQLTHVTPGARTLWAGDAHGAASTGLELVEGETREWNPVLGDAHGLRLRLVDDENAPLAGWLVVLRRPGAGGTWWIRRLEADAEGRVATHECPEGEVFLDVLGPAGLGPSLAARRVRAGPDELEVRIELRAQAGVRGLLLDAAGAPTLAGELQLVSLRTGMKSEPAREADGRFALHVPPGLYALVLRLAEGAAHLGTFELEAGAEHDLGTLQLAAPGTLRLATGALANGSARTPSYTLYAHFEAQRFLECAQGELDGEAVLTLLPGEYRVLLFDGAGQPPSTHFVTIRAFEETQLVP